MFFNHGKPHTHREVDFVSFLIYQNSQDLDLTKAFASSKGSISFWFMYSMKTLEFYKMKSYSRQIINAS